MPIRCGQNWKENEPEDNEDQDSPAENQEGEEEENEREDNENQDSLAENQEGEEEDNGEQEDQQPAPGSWLRDRSSLKRPNRYDDFINIEDIFIAENDEPANYKDAMTSSEADK